jgi:hypothetical protein
MSAPDAGPASTAPAQLRIADTMLRTLGGETALLHIPAPAIPGDVGEQLGLALPQFQDVGLSPAVLRKVRPRIATGANPQPADYELLVSATAVTRALGIAGFASAATLFAQATSLTIGGESFRITSATGAVGFGQVYLYRLGLRANAADLV